MTYRNDWWSNSSNHFFIITNHVKIAKINTDRFFSTFC
jgi:hypothetical protein